MTLAPDQADHLTARHDVLAEADPDVARLIEREGERQHDTLEMIASENHVSSAVRAAAGSVLTNKYAEGYPAARYYNGCGIYDEVEQLCIDRACRLFGCEHANVQPHSGANANLGVMLGLFKPGDTFMSINLASGGHLSHGMKLNVSAKMFNPVHYELDADERIDFDDVLAKAKEHKPTFIMCGYSAYPRTIDFAKFRDIADEVGAVLWADIAHIAGLVAGGAHPSPFPHCDVVTTTTHKTLRGPRGGLILCNDDEILKKVNRGIFPGSQGGPLMHIVAAKAVAFGEALEPSFKDYAAQVVTNAKTLAEALQSKGYRLVGGGTDTHLVLVDLRDKDAELTGRDAADALEAAGIIANMNGVPNDSRPPRLTSGVRLGTAALTTRGLVEDDIHHVANFIDRAFAAVGDDATLASLRSEVSAFAGRFPMPS
ncbi:MAG: serine hydroxymethyltransferase, partial [Planctomycetota bacterium]